MEQVNEAEKQLEDEQRSLMSDRNNIVSNSNQLENILPWETSCEVSSILSQDLMEQVLAISQHESNFLEPPFAKHPAI